METQNAPIVILAYRPLLILFSIAVARANMLIHTYLICQYATLVQVCARICTSHFECRYLVICSSRMSLEKFVPLVSLVFWAGCYLKVHKATILLYLIIVQC